MKKLITSIAALAGLSVASYAQRVADVSVVLASPTPTQVLNCTDSFLTEFFFINSGTTTILTTDTLVFQSPMNRTPTGASILSPRVDAAPGDTIAWFRFNTAVAQLGILLNETADDMLTAPFANGNYGYFVIFDRFLNAAEVTDDNNANDFGANLISIDCAPTSINNLAKTNLTIFPNPAQGQINVNFEALASNATLRVVDIMGRTILTKEIAKNTSAYSFDISSLNNGAYYLELTSGEVRGTSKFVVSK